MFMNGHVWFIVTYFVARSLKQRQGALKAKIYQIYFQIYFIFTDKPYHCLIYKLGSRANRLPSNWVMWIQHSDTSVILQLNNWAFRKHIMSSSSFHEAYWIPDIPTLNIYTKNKETWCISWVENLVQVSYIFISHSQKHSPKWWLFIVFLKIKQ